ncbi:hypothetical protein MKW92_022216 [Papaver armeniacum]|nr:hypothetical protein MKW92_022216 [Papaver armeniacum]
MYVYKKLLDSIWDLYEIMTSTRQNLQGELNQDLHVLHWTKFFVVCEPGTQHMDTLLKIIYELYTDYVLKNPFYEMEMPIRCELFDINLIQGIQKDRVALLGR